MKVQHDNIIFHLQSRGGITTYWKNLQSTLISNLDLVSNTIEGKVNISRYLDVPTIDGVDVFHSSFYRLPLRKSISKVTTVHDFIHEKINSHSFLSSKINAIQKQRAIRASDHIICVSENTRKDLLDMYQDIPEHLVSTIHLGVDRNNFFVEKSDEDTLFLENSVLFVGSRFGYKNFQKCVEIIKYTDFNLIIVGSELNVKERALLSNLSRQRWRLYSNCSDTEIRRLYSTCFALLYPSEYEGFGLPLIEAYACRCPVLHSGKGSLREVLNEGESYIASSGEVEEYISHLELLKLTRNRIKLFNNYSTKLAYFSWERVGNETLKIYENGVTK